MTSKEQAREQIARLIERYEGLGKQRQQKMNEANTRKDYVLPLFAALGWRVDDSSEVAEEVRVGETYADYAFKLDGVTRFFVEAKAVREDLELAKWAEQAVSYAWSKGVSWAVLTDFEGLKLFNAEWDVRDVNHLRVLDLHYSQYREHFDDLWALSRESVRREGLHKTFEHRGGAVRKRQPVGERLFGLFREWRISLLNMFQHFQPPGDPLRLGEMDEAVQRILDRLIFIRTIEDRRIEDPILWPILRRRQPKSAQQKTTGDDAWTSLKKEFRRLDDIYDSDLFRRHLADELGGDESAFLPILKQLYHPDGAALRFDFSAIEADVLGRVYEQYLGHVAETVKTEVRAGGQMVIPGMEPASAEMMELVTKQAKRKQQGIYYTPKYIVDYIVEQTLGRLLEERGGDRAFVESLTVLDPACGSGSFLIAAYERMLAHYAGVRQVAPEHLSQQERVDILTRHIYGVDLDPQAVEIARLNLILRALKEPGRLPLLDQNIVRGNSLISGDAETLEGYFGAEWEQKHPLNWEERFPAIMAGRGDDRVEQGNKETNKGLKPLVSAELLGGGKLWFVTFVTHNARVSERMVTYGVQRGEPVVFGPAEQVLIADKVVEACHRYAIPLVTLNVLPDHVHLIIAADDEARLTESVRKIKGYSSYAFQRAQGWEKGQHVWAQKFHRERIEDEAGLRAIQHYVETNHEKHADQWGDELIARWDRGLADKEPDDKGLKPPVAGAGVAGETVWGRGGFDVVIGNPPYVRMEEFKDLKAYLRDHYAVHADRLDLYGYFIERAHELLRDGGRFGMIVSNKFLRARYGEKLRQFVSEHAQIESLVDLAGLPIFPDAMVRTVVLTSRRDKEGTAAPVAYTPVMPAELFEKVAQSNTLRDAVSKISYPVQAAQLRGDAWHLVRSEEGDLLEKLRGSGVPLVDHLAPLPICRGVVSGLTQAFLIDERVRGTILDQNAEAEEIIKPVLNGRDVRRYRIDWPGAYLIYTYHGVDITRYPAVEAHLRPFREALEKRATRQEWYELQQPQFNYAGYMDNPKIIFPDIGTEARFALDTVGYYGTNTTYFLPSADLYLLGLLNSSLAYFYFKQVCAALEGPGEAYLRFFGQYLENLPVAQASAPQAGRVATHVEALLDLHRRLHELPDTEERREVERQIGAEDAALDALVYELYGLTEEEIALVEGRG